MTVMRIYYAIFCEGVEYLQLLVFVGDLQPIPTGTKGQTVF